MSHHHYTDSSQMTDDVVNQVIQDEMSIDQDMMNNNQGSSSEQQQQAHHQEHFEEQIQQSISQSKIPATSFSKLARLQQQQEPEYDQLEAKELDGEVFDVQRKYQLEAIRGQGSYGVVASAMNTRTGHKCAVKKNKNVFPRVSKNNEATVPHRSKMSQKRILRELKILQHLYHPNIVRLVDVVPPRDYDSFGDVYFVTELMEADLRDILSSDQPLTDQHVKYFVYQILLAVHYTQSANILHRDLKPENILLNSNCELKICDFGLARGIDFDQDPRMSTNYVQTRWYRAPELILNNDIVSKETDMWSIGCIMAELMGRKVLFRGTCAVDQMRRIVTTLGTPNAEDIKGSDQGIEFMATLPKSEGKDFFKLFSNCNVLAIDLLKRMLEFNHEKRITTEQAIRHQYFADLFEESDIVNCDALFDFSWEDKLIDSEDIKRECYDSIIKYRKDKTNNRNSYMYPNISLIEQKKKMIRERRQKEQLAKQQQEEVLRKQKEEQLKKQQDEEDERNRQEQSNSTSTSSQTRERKGTGTGGKFKLFKKVRELLQ
ncbi:protein kinase [Naegleria gruberi]|uniref:Protein kinase n=1 Tax=Naegleria gruberi TaxID=5762 RepID=D2VK56_NAEGR|nr:protein kinase [Naegleria gruberi]EFC42804.1 protein kinase [Naegleria gruberi]|eukprot:XP_002675548.1 protein kinase [Naegleria gruberi]